MFDYDRWLESPYTDQDAGCEDDCPVCTFECKTCEGSGKVGDEPCDACEGNGTYYEQQDRSEHRDYYADDYDDDRDRDDY